MGLSITDNTGFKIDYGALGEEVVVYLDAGHGGWDEQIAYQGITPRSVKDYVTQPNKMFRHSREGMHVDGWFCEGVFNRGMADRKAMYFGSRGVHVVRVADECEDTPLSLRVARANKHYNELTWRLRRSGRLQPNQRPIALYISIHANASPNHNARGTEVFTSPGVTPADDAAHMIFDELRMIDWSNQSEIQQYVGLIDHFEKTPGNVFLPSSTPRYSLDITLRKDWNTREKDKEANFYVLKNTAMPAVLIEYEFFDHPQGAYLLLNDRWAEIMAQATSRGAIKYLQWSTKRLAA